jgi:hypothetical protein
VREVFLAKKRHFSKMILRFLKKRFDHTFVFFFWKSFLKKCRFLAKKTSLTLPKLFLGFFTIYTFYPLVLMILIIFLNF